MEAARPTHKLVRKTSRFSVLLRSTWRKGQWSSLWLKNKGANVSSWENISYGKEEKRQYSISCGTKKAMVLLEQLVKDKFIFLPKVEFLPSKAYHKNSRYSPYSIKKSTLEHCFIFNKIFYKNHKAEEILFQEGAVNRSAISKHNDIGKSHVMMLADRWWILKETSKSHLRMS